MKTDEMNLTVAELDELCRLYMDCKLSVMEEKELEYVLSRTSLTSPSIAEVRDLIGVQTITRLPSKPNGKSELWNWRYAAGIAASVAILFGIGFTAIKTDKFPISDSCVAYVNGQEIQGSVAMTYIESETRKADEFISRMAELEEEEENKIDQFMNH